MEKAKAASCFMWDRSKGIFEPLFFSLSSKMTMAKMELSDEDNDEDDKRESLRPCASGDGDGDGLWSLLRRRRQLVDC